MIIFNNSLFHCDSLSQYLKKRFLSQFLQEKSNLKFCRDIRYQISDNQICGDIRYQMSDNQIPVAESLRL